MRLKSFAVAAVTVLVLGCPRSAHDRALDLIFAQQKAVRDSTARIVGIVLDAVTDAPVRGASLVTRFGGTMSDSAGRFVIPYVPRGVHSVRVSRLGYRTDSAAVEVLPPQNGELTIRAQRADKPCCDLVGRWAATFWLDSSAAGQRPTSRVTEGEVKLWPLLGLSSPWKEDSFVAWYSGYFDVNFIPFWGSEIAKDASTTFAVTDDALWMRSVRVAAYNGDWSDWEFIPNLSHGGVSLWGRAVARDSVRGEWEQRAYSSGASGRFLLVRVSADAGPRPIPTVRETVPPDTLLDAHAGFVFVRLWDEAARRYVNGRYGLQLDEVNWMYGFATKAGGDGWGRTHKYEPGRYRASVDVIPCGSGELRLRKPVEVRFVVRAGERTNVTVRVHSLRARAARTYENPEGKRCEIDPRKSVPAAPRDGL